MSTVAKRRYTPEEYLALERASPFRSEYVNGQIYAMTGGSDEHNVIVLNLGAELRGRLRGRGCRVYVNDMRVKVRDTGLYTYPDVAVVCSERQLEDHHVDTLLNPEVIIEVLSKSTEAYDRGEKFAHYRRLESLCEYVLVSQREVRVERYVRQGESWVFSEVTDLEGLLTLDAIGCTIPLREIYEGVELPASAE
jgi:Uma2 family endonuclease